MHVEIIIHEKHENYRKGRVFIHVVTSQSIYITNIPNLMTAFTFIKSQGRDDKPLISIIGSFASICLGTSVVALENTTNPQTFLNSCYGHQDFRTIENALQLAIVNFHSIIVSLKWRQD